MMSDNNPRDGFFFYLPLTSMLDLYILWFPLVCGLCTVGLGLLALFLGIVGRLCFVIVPVSILRKSIADRYRPVRVADGPITARYRFLKNAIESGSSRTFSLIYATFIQNHVCGSTIDVTSRAIGTSFSRNT